MPNIFDNIITQGVRAGQIPARTQQAREWYRSAARSVGAVNENQLLKSDASRMVKQVNFGSMYLFQYDPKHKDTLPYYDILPLIFPFESAAGGFYGLNVHYLPVQLRAKLMDALYATANNARYDEKTKLKINYSILKSSANLNYFKPCVKHYLNNHVKSQFMYVFPSEWDIALFLPLARFKKATAAQVQAESRRMIGRL